MSEDLVTYILWDKSKYSVGFAVWCVWDLNYVPFLTTVSYNIIELQENNERKEHTTICNAIVVGSEG